MDFEAVFLYWWLISVSDDVSWYNNRFSDNYQVVLLLGKKFIDYFISTIANNLNNLKFRIFKSDIIPFED